MIVETIMKTASTAIAARKPSVIASSAAAATVASSTAPSVSTAFSSPAFVPVRALSRSSVLALEAPAEPRWALKVPTATVG